MPLSRAFGLTLLLVWLASFALPMQAQGQFQALYIDEPSLGERTEAPLEISGWAISEQSQTGLSNLRVYQGSTCSGEILGETIPNLPRPDVVQNLNLPAQYANSGFRLTLPDLYSGVYTLTLCAYGADEQEALISETRRIEITTPRYAVDTPPQGAEIRAPFSISGWGVDISAAPQRGTGIDYVRIYRGEACAGQLIRETETTLPRPDVISLYRWDQRFEVSGFAIEIEDWKSGDLVFTTCFYNLDFDSPIAQETRRVTVEEGINTLILVAGILALFGILALALLSVGLRWLGRKLGLTQ